VKRYILQPIIILALATAAVAGAADDVSAEADRILGAAADDIKTMYRAMDERTLYLCAGLSVGNEFEEFEVLERLARSEGGRETVAAACRRAMAGDDPYLQLVAYNLLADVDQAEAASHLPDLYESLGESDVFMLATIAETALYRGPEETPAPGGEELYARLARDLRGDDKAARLKAAKVIALMHSESARELAAIGIQSPDAEVRRWCVLNVIGSYSYLYEEGSVDAEAVERALGDEDASVRAFAARRLGGTGDAAFVAPLLELLDDADVSVRRAAASSLSTLLTYASADKKEGVEKKLLKKIKAEPDGLTRCRLAEAYGAATATEEGCGRYLTDDGSWAFFTGEWRERDLEGYYETYDGGWGG
jgi:HEAT repeat protein